MKTHVLVKATPNYADEFNCDSFGVFSKATWEMICKRTKTEFTENSDVEVCFGTNESLQFHDYKDWERDAEVTEITEDEAKFLIKLFDGDNSDILTERFTYGTGDGYFNIGMTEDELDALYV